MEGFAPGLSEGILALGTPVRVVAFLLCVAGLMLQVQRGHDVEGLARPVVQAVIVVALIATLPEWFGYAEKLFLGLANTLQSDWTDQPMRAGAMIREITTADDSQFALLRMGEAVSRAVIWAGAKLVVMVGTLLQIPFLLLQHVLKWLCFLFLPVALASFMVPALRGLGMRYLQQTLAVLAWPVGFAVTELVAFHLVTGYMANIADAYGTTTEKIDPSSYASVLGSVLGSLWLILGTVATPFLMQALFCSGNPMTGGSKSAVAEIVQWQQILRLTTLVKAGGVGALAVAGAVGAAGASPVGAAFPVARGGGGAGTEQATPKPRTTI